MAVILVCLEGNIGVGKSTTIEYLVQKKQDLPYYLEIIREGVCLYNNFLNSHSPLKLSNEDPANLACAQMHIMRVTNALFMHNIEYYKHKYSGKNTPTLEKPLVILMERSPFSSMIFSRRAFNEGLIPLFVKDFLCYEAYHMAMSSLYHVGLGINGVLFLDAQPEICLRRVKTRGRDFEQQLSKETLTNLQSEYRHHMNWWAINPAVTTHSTFLEQDTSVSSVAKVITSFIDSLVRENRRFIGQ